MNKDAILIHNRFCFPLVETFYSIQGEGPYMGRAAIFVRLGECNLKCSFCDTDSTKYEWVPFECVWEMWEGLGEHLSTDLIKALKRNEIIIVITGGEPLLWQDNIMNFMNFLKKKGIYYRLHLETNGTIIPNDRIYSEFECIVCSPKFNHINIDALKDMNSQFVYFKFVLQRFDDAQNVKDLERQLSVRKEQIYVMPEAKTKSRLEYGQQWVVNTALENNWNYSDRLHLRIWNKTQGV